MNKITWDIEGFEQTLSALVYMPSIEAYRSIWPWIVRLYKLIYQYFEM